MFWNFVLQTKSEKLIRRGGGEGVQRKIQKLISGGTIIWNWRALTITENADTLLHNSALWNCTKFQSKRASCSSTGARRTWQPMIFTYFASNTILKFSWHSSLNLARSTCSFYWCYIFSFEYSWCKNINTEGKHMSFYRYWLLVNITNRKMGNWKKLKRAIFENNINVQKEPLEVSIKQVVLENFAIFIEKHLCWIYF